MDKIIVQQSIIIFFKTRSFMVKMTTFF